MCSYLVQLYMVPGSVFQALKYRVLGVQYNVTRRRSTIVLSTIVLQYGVQGTSTRYSTMYTVDNCTRYWHQLLLLLCTLLEYIVLRLLSKN
jgi:hypothetical protein